MTRFAKKRLSAVDDFHGTRLTVVRAANVFALMGLRQLCFLMGGRLRKLVYLSLSLSVILAFIGVKLIFHALHAYHLSDWAPFDGEIPIWLSLTVISTTLLITTVASRVKSRWDDDHLDRQETSLDQPDRMVPAR